MNQLRPLMANLHTRFWCLEESFHRNLKSKSFFFKSPVDLIKFNCKIRRTEEENNFARLLILFVIFIAGVTIINELMQPTSTVWSEIFTKPLGIIQEAGNKCSCQSLRDFAHSLPHPTHFTSNPLGSQLRIWLCPLRTLLWHTSIC